MLPLHVLLRLPSWIVSSNFWAGRCQRAYGTDIVIRGVYDPFLVLVHPLDWIAAA